MKGLINRKPEQASLKTYDLIVVGGGIYGVSLALCATLRGLQPLLLERDDFGAATSFNSLRIVHGGLRYLQTMDLHRFFESVAERRWFMQNFPGLVEAMPCLMPLYGKGLKRPAIFKVALLLNDLLSFKRNRQVSAPGRIAAGKVIAPQVIKQLFPQVDTNGLQGGAVWYDGSMPDSQRLLIEMLKIACDEGAVALNYMPCQNVLIERQSVQGVVAKDAMTGQDIEFRSNVVVNTAGPWCREVASRADRDHAELFASSLAWNVLLDRSALSSHALAVTPPKPDGQTYFLRPWKGRLFAGTIHEPWQTVEKDPMPSMQSIDNFIEDLNLSIKGLNLSRKDILHITSGLLPAREEGSCKIAVRERILDHAAENGPQGLFSVSGVKFTTARLVAEKTLVRIFKHKLKHRDTQPRHRIPLREAAPVAGMFDFDWDPYSDQSDWKTALSTIINQESVQHLDDLVLRRTTIGSNPTVAREVAPLLCELFDWSAQRGREEIERLHAYYEQKQVTPSASSMAV